MNEELLKTCTDNNNYTIYTALLQGTAYFDAVLYSCLQYQQRFGQRYCA